MLSEKVGYTQYRVRCPNNALSRLVAPEEYFTPLQTERMATHPDMILTGARIIAADFRAQGCHAQVRADAFVAFNGRPNARLIHPDADLAAVKPGIAPKWWILPHQRQRRRIRRRRQTRHTPQVVDTAPPTPTPPHTPPPSNPAYPPNGGYCPTTTHAAKRPAAAYAAP